MNYTPIPSIEEIQNIALQLPIDELIKLQAAIEEKIEKLAMMKLAETCFYEWDNPESDIYHDKVQSI